MAQVCTTTSTVSTGSGAGCHHNSAGIYRYHILALLRGQDRTGIYEDWCCCLRPRVCSSFFSFVCVGLDYIMLFFLVMGSQARGTNGFGGGEYGSTRFTKGRICTLCRGRKQLDHFFSFSWGEHITGSRCTRTLVPLAILAESIDSNPRMS